MTSIYHISRAFCLASLAILFAWSFWPAQKASGVTAISSGEMQAEKLGSPQTAATIIRTIVYRQISDFPSVGSVGTIFNMKMSADGSKIVFVSGTKLFTINTDGTSLVEVFDNTAARGAPRWIDISANGSKVIWDAWNLQTRVYDILIANSDGSNRVPIAPTFQNQFGTEALNIVLNPALTADGSRIYFTHAGSTIDVAGGYRLNADGTGLTKLFSYRQMSALFGKDGSEYNGNLAFRVTLAISDDGSRLVFGTFNFQADGNVITFDSATGLRKLTDFLAGLNAGGITLSGDGSKVVVVRNLPFPESRDPAIAMNFDGSNQIEIIRAIASGIGSVLIGMSTNGAQLLTNAAATTSLYNTDGSGQLDLNVFKCDLPFADPVFGANAGSDPNDGFNASITAGGRRFAFVTKQGQHQLWVADINPSSPGDAPTISEAGFNPNWILADRSTTSTFTARGTGGQGGVRHVCIDPLKDNAYQFRAFAGTLFDDGTNGDAAAGDGLYTNNGIRRDIAPPDPTTPFSVRFYGYANSLRQITAVDAVPFFVLTTPPAGSAPRIDSITPSSGAAGTQVKITGSGFDPVTTNNIVLIGNRQAVVKIASSDRTRLEVIVPPDLIAGVVPVTVTVAAQTSNAVNFNLVTSVQARESLPGEFSLGQNYPNPFNPSTTIVFSLPRTSHVTLKVFNLLGKEVATLIDKKFPAGRYETHWNASGYVNGVYFYRLEAEGNFIQTKKLLLLK